MGFLMYSFYVSCAFFFGLCPYAYMGETGRGAVCFFHCDRSGVFYGGWAAGGHGARGLLSCLVVVLGLGGRLSGFFLFATV
jgi:hypothetical protein